MRGCADEEGRRRRLLEFAAVGAPGDAYQPISGFTPTCNSTYEMIPIETDNPDEINHKILLNLYEG